MHLKLTPWFSEVSHEAMDVRPSFSSVGNRARRFGKPTILLSGYIDPFSIAELNKHFLACLSCVPGPVDRATAMTNAGWGPCFNVSDGFEGPLDGLRRRGGVGGWKAGGLPWAQT